MLKILHKRKDNSPTDSRPIESRQSLAPRMLNAANPSYKSVEELRIAMSMPECRNIAVTGVFGSGKSSVINTYLSTDSATKKVLRISLSNLIPDNTKLTKPEEKVKYENEIEYKIFQQIIHKADYRKTVQSRFKRINLLTPVTIKKIALNLILFFICFIILFEPKQLQIQSFYDVYNSIFRTRASVVDMVANGISAIIMMAQIYYALKIAIPKLYSLRISSFKANDFEVNFGDEEMWLSKKLGEILYYLKAGEYEAVFFEDLDRISHSQDLFLKLREINILLNESEFFQESNRIIRFVYAVKDDLFGQETRTKFFDYIVPVVPVVDYSNTGEYLISNCKDLLSDIRDTDIKTLGLFVPRMRDLINIINEYRLYVQTINDKKQLVSRQLFAMVIYKNLFPGDYSLLHAKQGCLYSVFSQKQKFYEGLIKEKVEEQSKLLEAINTQKESITKKRNVVLGVLESQYKIEQLSINGNFYIKNGMRILLQRHCLIAA